MDLVGAKVLVTGAALRVGRAIALEMARAGADLFVHFKSSEEAALRTAEEIRDLGVRADLTRGDLGVAEEALRVAGECEAADVLVNSASIFPRTPFGTVTTEAWDEIFDVNLRGPFLLSQVIGAAMRKRGRGAIVNITDWSADRPYKGYLPYCVSKAALATLTAGLARTLAPEVRVNAVAPGPVMLPENMDEADRAKIIGTTPLGREGSPEDVARAVRFLVEDAAFSTGAVLTVDGGRLIS